MNKYLTFYLAILIHTLVYTIINAQWIQQTSGTTNTLLDVSFTDTNSGAVVGVDGTILRTTNGGTTWIQQTSGTTNDLYGVSFTDANTGTAVGVGGVILRTTNGGTSWVQQVSGTSMGLFNVSFTDENIGTVVGNMGTILRTTNGGTTWNEQSSGIGQSLNGVSFTDINNGWAVGSNGTVLHTTNGGIIWTAQSSGTINNLVSVSFTDVNNGTAVGSGIILRTTNGGITWFEQSTPVAEQFWDVIFIDINNGTVVGNSSTILKTTNGGTNWIQQTSGIYEAFLGVSFVDEYTGTVVGTNGTILRTGNPAINISPLALTFGQVQVYQTGNHTFRVTNTGNAVLEVSSIVSSNPTIFSVNPTSATIQPSQYVDITVTFAPAQVTAYNGTINIVHNAAGSPSVVNLSGIGIEAINYPSQIDVNSSYTFGDFTQTSSYRIIGVPGNDDLLISNYLTGTAGKENDWRAFRDPGSGSYIEYPGGLFNFGKGRAYWILCKSGFSVNQTVGTGSLNPSDNTYTITINANGWNLITNPFDKAISWSDVQNVNSVTQPIYYYQSGSYSQSSQFEPYKGYYYSHNISATNFKIPYISPGEGPMNKQQVDVSKELEIELVMEGERRTVISIGFSEEAKIGLDKLDIFSPPSTFCVIDLALYNENLETSYKYLNKEYRREIGEGQEFEIKLKNTTGKSLELTAEGIESFAEYEVYLLDKRLNKLYNLKERNIVEVKRTVKEGDYSLLVGTESYILDKKTNLLPENYVLYQNYPNPFNPNTTIRFSIPKDEIITLTVYNILGELVKEVIKTQQYEAGYYEVELDGSSLSSGIYIYKLEADSFVETKKMVLLR